MKNKLLTKITAIFIALSTTALFAACNEGMTGSDETSDMTGESGSGGNSAGEAIATDEAYTQMLSAVTGTLRNFRQISVTANGSVEFKHYEEASESESGERLITERVSVDAKAEIKANADKEITALSAFIKLLPSEGDGIVLETYIKEGYQYSYMNLFGGGYDYSEVNDAVIDLEESDFTEMGEYLSAIKQAFPEPTATVNNGEYTIVWNVDNDNLGEFVGAVYGLINGDLSQSGTTQSGTGESADMDNSESINPLEGLGDSETVSVEGMSDSGESMPVEEENDPSEDIIQGIISGINVNGGQLKIVIAGGKLKTIDVSVDATRGEEGVKGSVRVVFNHENVTVTYPEGRLEEIRQGATDGEESGQENASTFSTLRKIAMKVF